jgi:TolB-like protein
MSFWAEIRRRNVVKVGAAYLIVAWLIAQIVSVISEPMRLPEWFGAAVLVLLAIGFPIALLLAWAYELTPEGIKKTGGVPLEKSMTHLTGQRLNYVVTALLVLAVAFMAINGYWLAPARPAGDGGRIGRVAVLPCDNLSPDPNDSYFAAGIHDELLNQLAQIRNLRVISRSSVMQYAENRPPIPQIGAALGVDSVMECGVRYNGDQVMLTAQLIDAATDEHVWSQSYPGDMSDLRSLYEIQASIARNVAETLRVKFFDEDLERIEQAPTESRAAYEHYLQGRSLMRENTPEGTRSAIEELEQAITLDPGFGLAHIALGQAYSTAWIVPTPANVERRDRAILDAVQFAPDEPGTQLLLAARSESARQWVAADAAYRKALELSPDRIGPNSGYALFLLRTGRSREALPYLRAARDADPAIMGPEQNLSQAYDALGDNAQALAHYERAKTRLGPPLLPEGQHIYSLVGIGALDEARQHWDSLRPLYGQMGAVTTELFGTAIELLDDPPAARAALRALNDQPAYAGFPMSGHLANWAAHFEDAELAVAAFRKSARVSTLDFVYLWLPIWQKLRPLPEFKELARETGLVEYWREAGWPEHCRPLGELDFECD